ncbi:hypothetical protein CkaCkLH20_11863 [Colletotrichum karsti]|uniref:Heterokaryon incompatibility domain-containing protein n=1 Tax=Colletotrichum karsti TaxID=1095194 RepID=A0A9P6LFN9_9PEZI|nr:uncharacterized protein CkaCkLH20_11863 [Colletotrichum karsti]KAF9870557.1 hypothetical protein CkaCkLH20_11863 [Colletotrichum karsti]
MDVVYQRAHICIGLMSNTWEQRHLDALLLGYEFDHMGRPKVDNHPGRRGPPPVPPKYFFASGQKSYYEDLTEAGGILLGDQWNTRAWIFQEALVSVDKILLLFPIVGTDHITPTFDDEMREMGLFDAIRFFYPRLLNNGDLLGFSEFHNRKRCDAATALSFLNRRGLFRDEDRVAIMANLCGYELRLDTVAIEKDGYDLFHCVLALALVNGDLSLLPPELYKVPETHPIIFPPGGQESDFSWAHSLTQDPRFVYSTMMVPASNTTVADDHRQYGLSASGLSLLGTLWQVKEFISLKLIKTKHFARWQEAKKSGTSADVRREAVGQVIFDIIMLLRAKGDIEVADAILNSTSDPKFRDRAPPRAAPEPEKGFMKGPFSRKTRTDSQTVSTTSKDRRGNIFQADSIVESVLEMPRDLTEPPENMFWLSWQPSGERTMHQSWIVDRVMENGGLWLAHPADEWNAGIPFGVNRQAPGSASKGGETRDGTVVSISERWEKLQEDPNTDLLLMWRFFQESGSTFSEQSHAIKLELVSAYAKYMEHANDYLDEGDEGEAQAVTWSDTCYAVLDCPFDHAGAARVDSQTADAGVERFVGR